MNLVQLREGLEGMCKPSQIKHTFICVELQGETTRITRRIGRTLLTTNGRESDESLGLLPNAIEHIGRGEVANIVGHLKLSISTRTFGMNNSLGNSLAYMKS